ncbi:MAG: hypothetical protein Q7W16_01095 [Coriobacteriia bacterium]|nr:hypothetical protein [Coriobacteriia bacterium]
MDIVYMATAVVAGFGGSFWLGYRYGVRCRRLPVRRFRIANGIGMLIGLVLAVAGALLQLQWLWLASISVMAGSVTGLKYGLGRMVGMLRSVDGGAARQAQKD